MNFFFFFHNKQNPSQDQESIPTLNTSSHIIPSVRNFHQSPQACFSTILKSTMCPPWCLSLFLGGYEKPTSRPQPKIYRIITKQEVALHTTPASLWVIMWGKVYDFSSLQSHHLGGYDGKPRETIFSKPVQC